MRLINLYGPGDVKMEEIEIPTVGINDILISTAACGVCGTDLSMIKYGGTALGLPSPLPLGHETSGTVEAVGANISGIFPGMRLIVNPMTKNGVIGNGGTEGAFVDKLIIRDAVLGQTVYEIPEGISFDIAALTEPLAVALHAVNRASPLPESKTVVFGAGPIGLCIILWLRHLGVRSIVSVDVVAERLQRATELGATDIILASHGDLVACLASIHGQEMVLGKMAVGTDLYFDATGAASIIEESIEIAKRCISIVVVALYWQPLHVDFRTMLRKELTIITAAGYPVEFPQVIAALPDIRDQAQKLISHQYDFSDFFTALSAAKEHNAAKVMVTFY